MKGCDNCYYEYFDARAYPCSLCIRGVKRQDMWKEQIHDPDLCDFCKFINKHWYEKCDTCKHKRKDEPQTERSDK